MLMVMKRNPNINSRIVKFEFPAEGTTSKIIVDTLSPNLLCPCDRFWKDVHEKNS
jgi:hypothetical protein